MNNKRKRKKIKTTIYLLKKKKSFCTRKEMISKLKRLTTEWEKIFGSYTSNKGLITEYTGSSKN
jgi:P2-related tail formation protein